MSPDILTAGSWVVVRGVARWVESDPEPEPERFNPAHLIACYYCRARAWQPCRMPCGRPANKPHAQRFLAKCCPCGNELEGRNWYCATCRVERRREQWRAYSERRRQKRERDAA